MTTTEPAIPSNVPRALPWLLLAVLSGVLTGFSQPIVVESITGRVPLDPSGWTGLLALFGFVPALVAIDGAGPKRAYAVGFVTCLVSFSIVIHWIVTTVHVYGGLPLLVALATLLLLTSALAAYVAAAFAVSRVVARYFDWPTWVTFPPALAGVELLRNYGPLGGFPWGSIGHAFASIDVLRQGAALFGVTGLTFLAGVTNAALASIALALLRKRAVNKVPVVMATLLLAGVCAYGAVRMQHVSTGPTVKVALLQPNVDEGLADLMHAPKQEVLERFYAQQQKALDQGAQLVVWPEGSFPKRGLPRDIHTLVGAGVLPPDVEAGPRSALRPAATVLGAVAVGSAVNDVTGHLDTLHHNSAFVLDRDLRVKGRFDKTHLVPFGEYVPWPLGGIISQFIPLGVTTPGTSLYPVDVDVNGTTMSIGPIICFEGVFPDVARAFANNGATFFANLSDERWYGVSGMAAQHIEMYALRATETGRPIVRSTNTGISGWIDNRGRIYDKTAMYQQAVVVADVPLETTATLYNALGDWLALLSLAFTLLCWLRAMLGKDFRQRKRNVLTMLLAVAGTVSIGCGMWRWVSNITMDEARSTQATLMVIMGLLVAFGALSGRVWGRRAIYVVAAVLIVGATVAAITTSPWYLAWCLVAAVIAGLARKA